MIIHRKSHDIYPVTSAQPLYGHSSVSCTLTCHWKTASCHAKQPAFCVFIVACAHARAQRFRSIMLSLACVAFHCAREWKPGVNPLWNGCAIVVCLYTVFEWGGVLQRVPIQCGRSISGQMMLFPVSGGNTFRRGRELCYYTAVSPKKLLMLI